MFFTGQCYAATVQQFCQRSPFLIEVIKHLQSIYTTTYWISANQHWCTDCVKTSFAKYTISHNNITKNTKKKNQSFPQHNNFYKMFITHI